MLAANSNDPFKSPDFQKRLDAAILDGLGRLFLKKLPVLEVWRLSWRIFGEYRKIMGRDNNRYRNRREIDFGIIYDRLEAGDRGALELFLGPENRETDEILSGKPALRHGVLDFAVHANLLSEEWQKWLAKLVERTPEARDASLGIFSIAAMAKMLLTPHAARNRGPAKISPEKAREVIQNWFAIPETLPLRLAPACSRPPPYHERTPA